MDKLLLYLSFFGFAQGFMLSLVFYLKKDRNSYNQWLAGLFGFFSAIMLEIILSNQLFARPSLILETVEFGATLLAGPFIYALAGRLLGKPLPSPKKRLLHLLPFLFYVLYSLVSYTGAGWPNIPILLPLVHFQCYTVWLVAILWREGIISSKGKTEQPHQWLILIVVLLTALHITQWIRYSYADVPALKQLVPATAFLSFYVLSFYGLLRSRIFIVSEKYRNTPLVDGRQVEYEKQLLRLIKDEEIHTNPTLSLETLGKEMNIAPHILSQVINDSFGINFNQFINRYRVKTAECYLQDPANDFYTIDAIAEKAGFNSRSAFYSSFRKFTNTTPSEYRS